MKPRIGLMLLLAACNVPGPGDPCTSDFDCGNYVCDVPVGATSGVCVECAAGDTGCSAGGGTTDTSAVTTPGGTAAE
jgi:hypothetical protein